MTFSTRKKTVATVHLKVDPTFFPCRPPGQKRFKSWGANTWEGIFALADTSDDNFPSPDTLETHLIDDTVAPGDQLPTHTQSCFNEFHIKGR